MIKPQKFTSRLASIEKVSSKVYLKRFELVEPREITFLSGQTVMLQVAPGVNRSMSIASPPSEKTSIFVAHDVSPMGPYSQWTIKARVGDEMHFIGPLGVFVLDRESPRKAVFIATGTGVSPFQSMILDALGARVLPLAYPGNILVPHQPQESSSISTDRTSASSEPTFGMGSIRSGLRVAGSPSLVSPPRRALPDMVLYWGLRHEEDIFWQKEFEDLATKYPNFRFVLTLSQPPDAWPASNALRSNAGWQGKRGRVGDHVFADEQNLVGCDFYVCGSKEMVVDMTQQLLAKNVPKEQIKSERFY